MKVKNSTVRLTLLGVFAAIILLLTFTPLGYLNLPLFSITFLTIPVVVGAIVLGPFDGAVLGLVFGISSVIHGIITGQGALFLEANPLFYGVMCIVPRVLVGFLAGLIFKGLSKIDKHKFFSLAVVSLLGPLLNTVLFISALILLYNGTVLDAWVSLSGASLTLKDVLVTIVAVNGLWEAAAGLIVGTAISKAVYELGKRLKLVA
ncbi:MAG: ECF transporter S component [Oscillospiraceae bacterium]|jgi:uncharacterized membrane protein|nr:ECF transporter S component [Oscillospiraceae bacterium]